MKEYVIELNQDELDALAISSWFIGGLLNTSRIVFSEGKRSDTLTNFCKLTKIGEYRHLYIDDSASKLCFLKKVN